MKPCIECGETRPDEMFVKNGFTASGKQMYRFDFPCSECRQGPGEKYSSRAEREKAVSLWDEGFKVSEIAIATSRPKRTIWNWLYAAGRHNDGRGHHRSQQICKSTHPNLYEDIGCSERFREIDAMIIAEREKAGMVDGVRRSQAIAAHQSSMRDCEMWGG